MERREGEGEGESRTCALFRHTHTQRARARAHTHTHTHTGLEAVVAEGVGDPVEADLGGGGTRILAMWA